MKLKIKLKIKSKIKLKIKRILVEMRKILFSGGKRRKGLCCRLWRLHTWQRYHFVSLLPWRQFQPIGMRLVRGERESAAHYFAG